MIELIKALGMILFCLTPLLAVGLLAIWSHKEHTKR